jgi:hypothetical protein
LFQTPYFDETAYLTQSGQLYSEATAAAFGKVYCFGPTFRAEKSKTRRHLMEFWMVEPEVAFAELHDMMELAEQFLSAIVQRVLETRGKELAILERNTANLERVVAPFPRITYEEAIAILQKKGNPTKLGDDFGGDEETILSNECSLIRFVRIWPCAWMSWLPKGMEKLSEGDSASTITTCSAHVCENIICPRMPFVGISTYGDSGPFLTQDLEWASSVPSPGSVDSSMYARPSRFLGCCTSYTHRLSRFLTPFFQRLVDPSKVAPSKYV